MAGESPLLQGGEEGVEFGEVGALCCILLLDGLGDGGKSDLMVELGKLDYSICQIG